MATMITGGAGFIGSRLAKLLIDEGEKPVLFDIAPVQGPLYGAWRVVLSSSREASLTFPS